MSKHHDGHQHNADHAFVIRDLSPAECEAILRRNYVGRLAFSLHDRVSIEPLHYVLAEGWIYGRTSPGTKLNRVARNRWIAFEVDEVDALFKWRSVVVSGGCYLLTSDTRERHPGNWQLGIDALQKLVPGTFADDDPVAFRDIVFRIEMAEVTGREAVPRNP